jgi:hypothetical protein
MVRQLPISDGSLGVTGPVHAVLTHRPLSIL